MKLIVGLGNPGKNYQDSRHNVGFMMVDKLAFRIAGNQWLADKKSNSLIIPYKSSIIFVKPQTFMNSSGITVKRLTSYYKVQPSDVWVIHDDLDIRLGEYKIQKGVGPKLHYGISSIEEKLGREDFWRVRIGVDNREEANRIPGEDYVLQKFSLDERKIIDTVFTGLTDDLASKILE